MSKKDKKGKNEEQEIKAVNTDVDVENAYYNYEEPIVYETKKVGFFKKLFRGKKKVTTSNELSAQEENFYENFNPNDVSTYQEPPVVQEPPKREKVRNTPPPPPVYQEPVQNTTMNYNYQPPMEDVSTKEPMSKNIAYAIGALLLVGVIVFVVVKLMSKAGEKYYINVGTTTIALRPYEGEQITYLTNDSKKTTFTSSDTNVVTVNDYGYIQAKGYKSNSDGYMKATITVGTANTNKKIDVYVIPIDQIIPMEDFTVPSNMEIKLNEKTLIEISNITPPNNTRQKFDYTSKDTSIATVDGVGVVTGKKKGTTTIEVRNHINKNITKEITVTVK